MGIRGNFTFLNQYYSQNPFSIVWANDINAKAIASLKLNLPDTKTIICDDIVKILSSNKIKFPKADVVVGGFPCQDFSLAGKRAGLTVKRGQLYLSLAKVVSIVNPKVFMAENVKGLLSWKQGLAIQTIVNDFKKLGYKVEYKLLNAADFGVPQIRERVIIVGIRNDMKKSLIWPKATHSQTDDKLKKWVTLREAIGDLEDKNKLNSLKNNGFSKAKLTLGKQGNTRLYENKPSVTMRAEHHGNIEFHYKLNRRLSAREAARIQSFPDDFEFVSSTTDAYRQVGNAVAPVFAWHLAQMIKDLLS